MKLNTYELSVMNRVERFNTLTPKERWEFYDCMKSIYDRYYNWGAKGHDPLGNFQRRLVEAKNPKHLINHPWDVNNQEDETIQEPGRGAAQLDIFQGRAK